MWWIHDVVQKFKLRYLSKFLVSGLKKYFIILISLYKSQLLIEYDIIILELINWQNTLNHP